MRRGGVRYACLGLIQSANDGRLSHVCFISLGYGRASTPHEACPHATAALDPELLQISGALALLLLALGGHLGALLTLELNRQ